MPPVRPTALPRWRFALAALVLLAAVILLGQGLGCDRRPAPRRIVLVGLDGADWAVIDRLSAAGDLPNLSRLKAEGTWARLASIEPMLSPILWTTIATGMTADKHGITWFMVDNPRTGGRLPITSNIRRVKAFWNMLSERGIKTAVIGWWATWPAERIDGFIVSDFAGIHSFGVSGNDVGTDLGKTHPPELAQALAAGMKRPTDIAPGLVQRFLDVPPEELAPLDREKFDYALPLHHFRNILASAESYRYAATTLLTGQAPRVTAVYFEGIDSTSHLFMQYQAPRMSHVTDGDWARYQRAVDEYYRYQDEIVGDLIAAAGVDATFIVVSDHGFKTGAARPQPEQRIDVPNAHRWHEPEGILIVRGPGIRANHRLEQASIADITPTLLYLLGLPVGDDMDGQVLTDLLAADSRTRPPIERVASWESATGGAPGGTGEPPPQVTADVEERLRALGYIGDQDDSSAEVHGNMGNIELHRGDVLAALEAYQKSAKMDPLSAQAHRGLGFIYQQLGRTADAVRELEYTLKLSPESYTIRVELADLLFDTGDLERAARLYAEALARQPDLASAGIGLGNVARMRGDNDGARLRFERAIELEPNNFVPYFNLGVLAAASGDLVAAHEWYEKAAILGPKEAVVQNNLAGLFEREGRLDEATARYRRARDADPRHFESRYNLGTLLLRKGELAAAEEALKEALLLMPDAVYAHNNLAILYLRRGLPDKALREYEVLIRLSPTDPKPRYEASRLNAVNGDLGRARELLAEAIRLGGEPVRAAARVDPVFAKTGLQGAKP